MADLYGAQHSQFCMGNPRNTMLHVPSCSDSQRENVGGDPKAVAVTFFCAGAAA